MEPTEPLEPLDFVKGHGTGNDFVVLADPAGELILTPELVAALCDRRLGIGADGVLRVVRTLADPQLAEFVDRSGAVEWFMDYRNADGSVAEICGNGIRVFARYLVDAELVAVNDFIVGTRAGPVPVVVSGEAVSATLGAPRLRGTASAWLGGRELPGTVVDCGNPHLVCPVGSERELAELDLTQAPAVDPGRFPDGVNVEFTAPPPALPPDSHQIAMRVYERGVGETRSCGSGACAAAAASLRAAGRPGGVVTVDVPGGRLTVAVTADDCVLTGPAVLVARGTVAVDALPYG